MSSEANWWLCPNTPRCPHGGVFHDVEDMEDTSPMCCIEGCACGGAESLPDWCQTPVERYCVHSGRPVAMIPGDRCRSHSAAATMCTTDVRPAQCEHPYPSPNHPTPTCSECGKTIPEAAR